MGLLLLATTVAHAQSDVVPCALLSKGDAVLLSVGGDVVPLPDPQHANCLGLQVHRGRVVACVRAKPSGGHCRSFGPKDLWVADKLLTPPGPPSPVDALWAMLTDSQKRVYAISRSDEPLPPLPTGPTLLLQDTLTVDFASHPSLRGAQALELRAGGSDGPPLAAITPASPHLPTEVLKPGQTYVWRVRSDQPGLPLLGRFSVLPADQRAAGLAERARITQAAPGDVEAQAVLWAGWLHAQGARHEAALALRAAGIGAP